MLRVFRTPDSEVLQRRKRLPPPSPNLAKLVLSQREKKCCLNPAPLSLRQMRDGLQGAGPHLLWEQDLAGLSLTDRRALGQSDRAETRRSAHRAGLISIHEDDKP